MNTSSKPKVLAIVQARLGSVRFPEKVLQPVLGVPIMEHLLTRLGRSNQLTEIILAIPDSRENDALERLAVRNGVGCSRGDEFDVLSRFYAAATAFEAEIIVRITGDCPLIDPSLVDEAISLLILEQLDYVNTDLQFPDGLDVEVFTIDALSRALEQTSDQFDREHVTPFIRRDDRNRIGQIHNSSDLSSIRITLDEQSDLEVIKSVFEHFGSSDFPLVELFRLIEERPEIFAANKHLNRNEGAFMSTGQKLWKRARRIIPGGSMLLSKRAEMHLPSEWPAYFSRTKGCSVWDLDGREYIDVGMMGVGTNILGYSHPKVDEAVRHVVSTGNLSTLNCPEEVYLAEELCRLHPWAEMARFTRSGGEACAVATRIGRAASGKDGVAFCGYHGWHDWYLSANLANDSVLDGHLLPGLEPRGVPRTLQGTARAFEYNNLSSLEVILQDGVTGVVFMEVERGTPPAPGFLSGVRELASKYNAVLVFDECTSGFRKNLGGLHMTYGVEPDITVFGKTLGNGYAINAIIGRRNVMEAAQATFISSTFWTERIGPAAALATIKAMSDEDAPSRIDKIGLTVRSKWAEMASSAGLQIQIGGIPALSTFSFVDRDATIVKTFVTSELLKSNHLASSAIYVSIAHKENILTNYLENLNKVFQTIASCSDIDLLDRLPNGVAQVGFKRLA